MEEDAIVASWGKDFSKILLSKDFYFPASASIRKASSDPSIENIKELYGAIEGFISALPLPQTKMNKKEKDEITVSDFRKDLLIELHQLRIVFGDVNNEIVRNELAKIGLLITPMRSGNQLSHKIENLPFLIDKLQDIFLRASEFAVSKGLIVSITSKPTMGREGLFSEAGLVDKVK